MLKRFFLKMLLVLLLLIGKNISVLCAESIFQNYDKDFCKSFQSLFQYFGFGAVSSHIANVVIRLLSSISNLYY